MNDDESPGLGLDLPEQPQPATGSSAYRVLARKYRPQTFDELIGQDAMVKTLANAIERGRIAHAFLLTGVRGVGKTSTARRSQSTPRRCNARRTGSTPGRRSPPSARARAMFSYVLPLAAKR